MISISKKYVWSEQVRFLEGGEQMGLLVEQGGRIAHDPDGTITSSTLPLPPQPQKDIYQELLNKVQSL